MPRLLENLGAASFELTPDNLREIKAASDKMTFKGRVTLNTSRNWSAAERKRAETQSHTWVRFSSLTSAATFLEGSSGNGVRTSSEQRSIRAWQNLLNESRW